MTSRQIIVNKIIATVFGLGGLVLLTLIFVLGLSLLCLIPVGLALVIALVVAAVAT